MKVNICEQKNPWLPWYEVLGKRHATSFLYGPDVIADIHSVAIRDPGSVGYTVKSIPPWLGFPGA
jgi:hypothetical protein